MQVFLLPKTKAFVTQNRKAGGCFRQVKNKKNDTLAALKALLSQGFHAYAKMREITGWNPEFNSN